MNVRHRSAMANKHHRLSACTDRSANHQPWSPDMYLGTSKQQMVDKKMIKAPLGARCASLKINSSAPRANWALLPMALCASPDESERSEIGGAHDGQHSTPADRRSRLTFCPLLQQSQQWPGLVVWLGTHQIRHANRRSTCTATGALGEHDPFPRANGPRAPLARRFDHLIEFTVVRKARSASRLQHCWLGRTMYKRAIKAVSSIRQGRPPFWRKPFLLISLNQSVIDQGLLNRQIIQLPAQHVLVDSDGIEPPSDSSRCISADVFAGVSKKVRIAQMLEMGFQLKVDRFHSDCCRFPWRHPRAAGGFRFRLRTPPCNGMTHCLMSSRSLDRSGRCR